MSVAIIALVCGLGAAGYAWSYLARSTGNARPAYLLTASAVVGVVVFVFLLTLLKLVLHF